MSSRLWMVFLAFLLLNSSPQARESGGRRAIVFGGGCETENRLAPIMAEQIRGLRGQDWEVSSLFASEAGSSNAVLVSRAAGVEASALPDASKQTLLNALDSVIQDPRFKNGGQLLISFNTHGRPKPDGSGHRLCLQSNLATDSPIEMDLDDREILERLQTLKSRNVRMGFTDMSCYGGASVAILRQFGCVISSQADNRESATYGVSGALANLLKLPKNDAAQRAIASNGALTLEDVYLDTLLHGLDYRPKSKHEDDSKEEWAQNPVSSLFEKSDAATRGLLEILPSGLEAQRDLSQCELETRSLPAVDAFLSALKTQIQLDTLEKLSGRKIGSLEKFAADLKGRILEQLNVRARYETLRREKATARETLYSMKFKFVLKLPQDLAPLATWLRDAIGYTSQGDNRFSLGHAGSLSFEVSPDFFSRDLEDSARRMHSFLSEQARVPGNDFSEKSVPSILSLKKLAAQIQASAKVSAGSRLTEMSRLQSRERELDSEISDLETKHPFLVGRGRNDVSRDFNLMVASAYLMQRDRWTSSRDAPESFRACAEFPIR